MTNTREYSRAWRKAHPNYDEEWRAKNPAKNAEKCRRYRLAHPERKTYQQVKKYVLKYPWKKNAQCRVYYAIRTGKLTRMPCRICGNPKSHAHHPDYSKPLEVIWLCVLHHRQEHKKTLN